MDSYVANGFRAGPPRHGAAARHPRDPRLTVRVGDLVWAVTRRTETGFAIAAEPGPPLRGLVDLYEGERHLMQCLVMRIEGAGPETIYEFKRATPPRDSAPVDFELDPDAPVALIEGT